VVEHIGISPKELDDKDLKKIASALFNIVEGTMHLRNKKNAETDRKSLLALRGVGPESEAESVRFHGRRVTKVGPEVKHGLFRGGGRARNPKKLPPEGWVPLNKGCERWDATGTFRVAKKRHERFDVVVGKGGRATNRGSFSPAGRCRNARAAPLARARDGAGCAR
jgi:hypothetical protein